MLGAALLVVLIGSELALGGIKLQTGLSRALAAWTLVYLISVYPLSRFGDIGFVAFTIFWGGAFLSWFGVRSHLESSILLRMLVLLRQRSLSERELVASYTALYGEAMRREELFRAGLAAMDGDRVVVSAKGRTILEVVAKLR
jgi:hypothetical protein